MQLLCILMLLNTKKYENILNIIKNGSKLKLEKRLTVYSGKLLSSTANAQNRQDNRQSI